MSKIKIISFPIGSDPFVSEIENVLEAMQELVGGYLEGVTLESEGGGLSLLLNEEGHLKGLPFNRSFGGHEIVGPFFLSRYDEDGKSVDVTEADIAKYV